MNVVHIMLSVCRGCEGECGAYSAFWGNLTGGCTPLIHGIEHSSQVSSEWERSPDLAGEIRSLTLCY